MATQLSFELAADRGPTLTDALTAELRTNSGNLDAERIERAYIERMQRYVRELETAYKQLRNGGHRKADEFPSLLLALPLGMETVVFDRELDLRLLQLYAVHGWSGVVALEAAVNDHRSSSPLGLPEPWAEVQYFLRATRHLLMLRIRSTLIQIEAIVANSVSVRLSDSSEILAETIATLDIKPTKKEDRGESAAHGGSGSTNVPMKIGNRELLAKIYHRFDEILRKKWVLERMRIDLRVLDAKIGATRQAIKQKTEGRSGGVQLPSELADSQEQKEIEQAEAERRSLARSGPDAENALQQLTEALGEIATLLILVIPQMKDGFSIDDIELAITDTFEAMQQRIEMMYTAIQQAPSAIPTYLPDSPADLDRPGRLDSVALRSIDACKTAVDSAIETSSDKPARLVMLSEDALLSALDREEIQQGSLAHIVAVHYLVALLDALEEKRKHEAFLSSISEGLASIGAALSLAALVASDVPTPQARAAAGSMELLGKVLTMPSVLFFAYSTLHQLRQLEETVNLRLVSADFNNIDIVAQLGEVDAFRTGFIEQIGSEFIKLLIENIAAGQITVVKKLILMRGYLEDLATLMPDGNENEPAGG